MKRAVLVGFCLLVISGLALGEKTVTKRTITGNDVQAVLNDFISSISKELGNLSKSSSRRRLQGVVSEVGPSAYGPPLVSGIHPWLQSIHDFFADILGKDWSDYVPDSWKNSSFSWSKLGQFEFSSNLQDFLSNTSLSTLVKPQSLSQLYDNLESLNDKFCTPAEFTKPELVPSTCAGPSVTLAYIPKECIINEVAKQIICSSPKLVLVKTPGSCTHKHFTPASWTGKECKLDGAVGFQKDVVVGGSEYVVPLSKSFFEPLPGTPAPAPAI